MRGKFGTALAAGVSLAAMVTQTAAGGYAAACYEQIREAPTYRTVYEQVLVSRGGHSVEIIPAVYGTEKRRVMTRPAEVSYSIVPARYAYQKERVLIEPSRTIARTIPAVVKTQHRKVKVDDGGYDWEYRWIDGRKVLCKIKRHATYRTVAETVVVHPARTVHETLPARYGYEKRKVLISHERREKHITPAEYGYVHERVLIRQAEKRVHRSAPVYETVARQVQVSEGRSGWRQISIRGHCKG